MVGGVEDLEGVEVATNLSPKLKWETANTIWSSVLNPVIQNPMNSMQILDNLSLVSGVNIINHKLGRMMQGWFVIDIQGIATLYRSSPFNDKTLTLTVSAPVVVSLGVF